MISEAILHGRRHSLYHEVDLFDPILEFVATKKSQSNKEVMTEAKEISYQLQGCHYSRIHL